MWWSNLFAGMSPASFVNFSFFPKYGQFFIQGIEYTLLLAVVSVALAVIPALLLALMRLSKNRFIKCLSGAYIAVFRSTPLLVQLSILAVDIGQTEAARSLGLNAGSSMRLVVLPQAIKNVLPALANEIVTMVKESSICSMLGMAELMFAAKTTASATYITLAPYTMAALIYFCINYPASKGIEAIERRMRRGDKQQ